MKPERPRKPSSAPRPRRPQSRPAANTEGLAARKAALALVSAALSRRGGFDEAIGDLELGALEPRDRAFARWLAASTLRRLGPVEAALEARLKRPPPDSVRGLLRIGAAQVMFTLAPAHAAVSTALALADQARETRPFKGLINAVLRGLDREPPPKPEPAAFLPSWLAARWTAAYGQETVAALVETLLADPPTDLSVKAEMDAAGLAEAIEGEVLPGGSVRTRQRGDIAGWPGFDEGAWWVQDAAAAAPVRLLAPKPGEEVLDLCAAPGGKTMQLAAAGARVVALDKSEFRLARVRENLDRTGMTAEVVAADAETWTDARQFDAVLLDAPCSATGTFRRQPEVLWAARPGDVGKLAVIQAKLLDSAARRVRPGGRLVYAVCSLEPEEGEGQIAAFLARHPEFKVTPADPDSIGAPADALRPEGWLRILPCYWSERGGVDGFFICRLARSDG